MLFLENRADGVYTYGTFNDTQSGKNAKILVEHGDLTSLSIFANQLKQKGGNVVHGLIREVSLVLAGANSEATIDNVILVHADGYDEEDETEAVIKFGEELKHSDIDEEEEEETEEETEEEEEGNLKTGKEIFDSMNEEQKNFVYALAAELSGDEEEETEETEEDEEDDTAQHNDGGKKKMKKIYLTTRMTKPKTKHN